MTTKDNLRFSEINQQDRVNIVNSTVKELKQKLRYEDNLSELLLLHGKAFLSAFFDQDSDGDNQILQTLTHYANEYLDYEFDGEYVSELVDEIYQDIID